MYNSETYGKIKIEDIPDKLVTYFNKVKQYDSPVSIIIGTDSQTYNSTKIVNVIAIVCEGHGGIYFYEITRTSKITDIRQKLYTETQMSLDAAGELLKLLENNKQYEDLYMNATFAIHVDAGHSDRGKTKELIPSIVGWIKAQGYDCEVKPNSFVSSSIADRISK